MFPSVLLCLLLALLDWFPSSALPVLYTSRALHFPSSARDASLFGRSVRYTRRSPSVSRPAPRADGSGRLFAGPVSRQSCSGASVTGPPTPTEQHVPCAVLQRQRQGW